MADDKSPAGSKPSTPALGTESPPGSNQSSPRAPATDPATSNPGGILPAHHWAQVGGTDRTPGVTRYPNLHTQNPVEDNDAESALGEEMFSPSTASVSSSIFNCRTLHGRRYHSEIGNAAYWYYRPRPDDNHPNP
ncbi:hypothetical protein IMZ48_24570 [Candidatus Bathyarchaeota archaeon]|nr:hypothetical protein [Candidatus Bathyarchaeota archaeon]